MSPLRFRTWYLYADNGPNIKKALLDSPHRRDGKDDHTAFNLRPASLSNTPAVNPLERVILPNPVTQAIRRLPGLEVITLLLLGIECYKNAPNERFHTVPAKFLADKSARC